MTSSSNRRDPEKLHEAYPEVFAPPRVGNGTFDDDWEPGRPDKNKETVHELSDPERPGIKAPPELVDIGGIHVTKEQAIRMGFLPEDDSLAS